MAVRFQGAHCPKDLMRMGVRWSGASPLSTRQVEALREARGGSVDPSTLNRRVVQDRPPRAEACHRRQPPVWASWRLEEPDSRVTGQGRSLDRAVDQDGPTIDVWLTEHRETETARRLLTNAIRCHSLLETLTMDGRDATEAAITRDHAAHGTTIHIPLGQRLQQDRGAGPSRRQTERPSDARVHIV